MSRSGIEWTESTWNPLTGCIKISPGCKHCYAERMAKRLQAQAWQAVAGEYPGKVAVQEHLSDDRQVMSLDCMIGSLGVYIDGEWGPGYPIEKEEMRKLIQTVLSRKE